MTAIPGPCAVLSVAEMYAADRAAAAAGIEALALMEAAGAAIARLIQSRWPKREVAVLCGPGNNGGDGFVVARLLSTAGWSVRLGLLGERNTLTGDAAVNAERWCHGGGRVLPLADEILDGGPLVVDALFGAGLKRGLSGVARELAEGINRDRLECVAVDLPSGIDGDTGEILAAADGIARAPRATATVTFFRPKPAHLLYPARDLCGDVMVADIGIPDSVLGAIGPRFARNTPALWQLPAPRWSDHKYNRGAAIVIGGGDVTGASRLAARAARRAGAGLLTLAVPPNAVPIYASAEAGSFVQPLANLADLDRILSDHRRNGVLIGPGAGLGTGTCMQVLRILATDKAVVLDADALSSFADDPATLFAAIRRRSAPVVLTPHEGEFGRLFKVTGSKLQKALSAARECGAVVILKGADTVVAAPDGRASIAANAPPWLATGGSGDVLAGFVLGLLVQHMPAWEAASAAVWLHGETGTVVGRGLIAEDLPEALPKVLKSL